MKLISNFSKNFLTYDEAKKFAKKNNLKSARFWFELDASGNMPDNLPSRPDNTYKNKGWTTWGDFLGTGRISDNLKKFRTFSDSRNFVRLLGLKSVAQWQKYASSGKRPKDIPGSPPEVYKTRWTTWGDFLGTGNISFKERSEKWMPWKEAKPIYQKIAKENGIKTNIAWFKFVKTAKLPKYLPPYPRDVYTLNRAKKLSNNQR